MSKYTLAINIRSDNRELLENLLVTLETVNGDLGQIDTVELVAVNAAEQPRSCRYQDSEQLDEIERYAAPQPTQTQRHLFIDKWTLG